jgi:hypothetical protein
MPDTVGSLIRHAAAAACLGVTIAARAIAQPPLPAPTVAPPEPQFLARYNFHLMAASLGSDDDRFKWDSHFGGDLDLVDYVKGRANILADYEAVLGNQLRAFDPNQGNYTLEASSSIRAGATEIAGVFHHVSRHLSDRPKIFAIAWNVLGVRVLRRLEVSGATFDVQGGIGHVTQRAFVDYVWTAYGDVVIRRPINHRLVAYAHGNGELFGIDAASSRGTQQDGRFEAGIRILGTAAALELFAGLERRIDADPIDEQPQRWTLAGFRIVSK